MVQTMIMNQVIFQTIWTCICASQLRVIEQLEVKVILKELNLDSIDITKVLTLPILDEKEEDKWKHTKPPQNCNHKYNLSTIYLFDKIWTSQLGFFYLFYICLIGLQKSNKHWRTWMYGIYL
jgi:hypothetical protein